MAQKKSGKRGRGAGGSEEQEAMGILRRMGAPAVPFQPDSEPDSAALRQMRMDALRGAPHPQGARMMMTDGAPMVQPTAPMAGVPEARARSKPAAFSASGEPLRQEQRGIGADFRPHEDQKKRDLAYAARETAKAKKSKKK